MTTAKMEVFADAKGEVFFHPIREPGSAWARWECWRNCAQGETGPNTIGLVPVGDWLAWDSETDQIFGFPVREKAEKFCVTQNAGEPTRVYDPIDRIDAASTFALGAWDVVTDGKSTASARHLPTGATVPFGDHVEQAIAYCKERNGAGVTRVVDK